MTHDYKRHGTTTLFAALDMATGKVIGECLPRHRAKEFIKFLRKIDQQTLPGLDLHLIVDNYATHKTAAVQRWLKRHCRFKLHFNGLSANFPDDHEMLTHGMVIYDALYTWCRRQSAGHAALNFESEGYCCVRKPNKGGRNAFCHCAPGRSGDHVVNCDGARTRGRLEEGG